MSTEAPATDIAPPRFKPLTSLELRVRQLEFLVRGNQPSTSSAAASSSSSPLNSTTAAAEVFGSVAPSPPLSRRAEEVRVKLEEAVGERAALDRFVRDYERNLSLLTPRFALSHLDPTPTAPASLDGDSRRGNSTTAADEAARLALVLESEGDIREALCGLEEVQRFDQRGVAGAGDLADHHDLAPRLQALLPEHRARTQEVAELEGRLVDLLGEYDRYVTTVSETFVELNALVRSAEEQVAQMERESRKPAGDTATASA